MTNNYKHSFVYITPEAPKKLKL